MRVCISSGHGKYVSGASGIINEVAEARKVVFRVCEYLRAAGVFVTEFHDDISRTQAANLSAIVGFHNRQARDLDVSVHFNAAGSTSSPRGAEVFYYSELAMANALARAIADASGLKNRGAKKRTDLYFLNGTAKPAVLIEVCFVDSSADVKLYQAHFDDICRGIAEALSGKRIGAVTGAGGTVGQDKQEGRDTAEGDEDMAKRFDSIEEIPGYAKETVQKLIDRGFLSGSGTGLDLTEDMIRVFVVLDRIGVYDRL